MWLSRTAWMKVFALTALLSVLVAIFVGARPEVLMGPAIVLSFYFIDELDNLLSAPKAEET